MEPTQSTTEASELTGDLMTTLMGDPALLGGVVGLLAILVVVGVILLRRRAKGNAVGEDDVASDVAADAAQVAESVATESGLLPILMTALLTESCSAAGTLRRHFLQAD